PAVEAAEPRRATGKSPGRFDQVGRAHRDKLVAGDPGQVRAARLPVQKPSVRELPDPQPGGHLRRERYSVRTHPKVVSRELGLTLGRWRFKGPLESSGSEGALVPPERAGRKQRWA